MGSFNYQTLDIQNSTGKWLCPCCGYDGTFYGGSFESEGPLIGTGICSCCLYEPGFDDVAAASGCQEREPLAAIKAYSQRWRESGFQWQGKLDRMPNEWNGESQFHELRKIAPLELFDDK